MGRRKRSPSNNTHNQNFEVPNLQGSSSNNNTLETPSEENSNEPNDPDDSSRYATTINIHDNNNNNNDNTINYSYSNALDIDISMARAFSTTPFPHSKSLHQRRVKNMNSPSSSSSSSYSSSSSSNGSYPSSASPLSYFSSPASSYVLKPNSTGNNNTNTNTNTGVSSGSPASLVSLMRKHTSASYNVSTTNAMGTTYAKTSRLSSSLGAEKAGSKGIPSPNATASRSRLGASSVGARIPTQTPHMLIKRYPTDPSSTDVLDVDATIEKLLKMGVQTTSSKAKKDFPFRSWEIQLICSHAREVFLQEPSLLRLQAPVKVVGDVHGQFNDLLRILKLSGSPPDTSYLFLGDYVDRGKQSLETILLLLCYKLKYRGNFFMLRGNHESANVTKIYGFYDECKRRMGSKSWRYFVDVFNTLPIAATIQDRIFCVHGGISPDMDDLNQINHIMRPTDIPDQGLLTDLLWSDPDPQIQDWALNDRGVSYTFSKKNVYDFCSKFKFDLVIRGHMVVEDGYEFFARKKLVTVFSAPNYCGEFQNWGAVMSVTTGLMCSFELLKPHSLKNKKTRKSKK
ncbi:Serine threonine-protein phosphatase [Nakaseomyces bracarensis]|uniref:Serine/threonine-protein phosphatase n=1 Tax=Nakaseomyces bracarensis TaxID=273131 RepID=A0ABR4NMS6_9SACH